LPQVIFTIIGIDYEVGEEEFSFTLLVNMLHTLQVFTISTIFVFFSWSNREGKENAARCSRSEWEEEALQH